jgi:hypothetical protein
MIEKQEIPTLAGELALDLRVVEKDYVAPPSPAAGRAGPVLRQGGITAAGVPCA